MDADFDMHCALLAHRPQSGTAHAAVSRVGHLCRNSEFQAARCFIAARRSKHLVILLLRSTVRFQPHPKAGQHSGPSLKPGGRRRAEHRRVYVQIPRTRLKKQLIRCDAKQSQPQGGHASFPPAPRTECGKQTHHQHTGP